MILKKPTNEIIKSIEDNNGNIICTKNNGKRIIIYLKLPKHLKIRKIGTIDIIKKQLTIKRIKEKHLFRKYNGYGFNVYILRNAKTFETIKLIDNYNTWIFNRDFAEQNIKYLTFSKQGFETQGFLSLEQLEQFKK